MHSVRRIWKYAKWDSGLVTKQAWDVEFFKRYSKVPTTKSRTVLHQHTQFYTNFSWRSVKREFINSVIITLSGGEFSGWNFSTGSTALTMSWGPIILQLSVRRTRLSTGITGTGYRSVTSGKLQVASGKWCVIITRDAHATTDVSGKALCWATYDTRMSATE